MKKNHLVLNFPPIQGKLDLTAPGLWCVSLTPSGQISELKSIHLHRCDDHFLQCQFILSQVLSETGENPLVIRVCHMTHYFDEWDWMLVDLLLKRESFSSPISDYIKTTADRTTWLSDYMIL